MSDQHEPESYEVDAVAGEPVALPITIGPTTGHRWLLDLPAGVTQLAAEPAEPASGARSVGGETGRHLQVVAEAGDYTIAARLARPWQPDNVIRSARIRLRVRDTP